MVGWSRWFSSSALRLLVDFARRWTVGEDGDPVKDFAFSETACVHLINEGFDLRQPVLGGRKRVSIIVMLRLCIQQTRDSPKRSFHASYLGSVGAAATSQTS